MRCICRLLCLALAGTLITRAPAQDVRPLTLEEAFQGTAPALTAPLPSITGWSDDARYVEDRRSGPDSGLTLLVDARTGTVTGEDPLTMFADTLQDILPDDLTLRRWTAADSARTFLVYSRESDLYVLDVRRREFRRLTSTPEPEENPDFSPDGVHLAYTREHDLYVTDVRSGQERRLTTDGSDVILNGRASWVYWEEIFGRATRNRAFWWSPDGTHIAFFRFDDSRVPVYTFPSISGSLAPATMRYPRAGDPNPGVRIGVASVGDGLLTWAAFDGSRDQYFGTPFWTPDGRELFVQWMNRGQDSLILYGVDPSRGTTRRILTEHQASWVEWFDDITFLPRRKEFVVRSDRDGWGHLYLYAWNGNLRRRLTSGPWQVERVVAVDEPEEGLFFTAKQEASTRTDLYRVAMRGGTPQRLTFGPYTHTVQISPHGAFFITTYSNLSTPPRMALLAGSGTMLRELGNSRTEALGAYRLALPRLVTISVGDGYDVPALIMLPPEPVPGKRYPVLISTYGGPASASVSEGWRLSMADQGRAVAGLIQMTVDHRGSGHFGKAAEALMHRNLGTWELHDYIEIVKWLRRQPYVDSTKICMTGASYGGYVTALALTAGAEYFTHGIASLSVTDWRLYDSHYTERYMDSPAENPGGYAAASVLTYAGRYHGLLRIVHGMMDDNVHLVNALELADTLENLNRHFELMLYPDQRHGVGGAKFNHARMENMRFYYTHLLEKPFPAALFQTSSRAMMPPH
jgi:dipeptidyl-peptidase 4